MNGDLQSYKNNGQGLNTSTHVGQKRSKNDIDKVGGKRERSGRLSSDNRIRQDSEARQKAENDAENSMLLMDINDSFIFKESPTRQDVPAEGHHGHGQKPQQETAELENIISEKDNLIQRMKD